MTQRPWWRRVDGLPPRVERRRRAPLSPGFVWATRASLLAPIVAVGLGVAGIGWFLAVVIVPVTAFSIWAMPAHQRRQVFSR